MRPEKITIETVEIDTDKVLLRLGYVPSKTALDSKTERSIDNLITDARKWLVPKAVYRTETISKRTDRMVCLGEDNLCIMSTQVASLLANSFQVSAFAVSIGQELTSVTQAFLKDKKVTEAAITDAIGSVVVESLAEQVNRFLIQKGVSSRARLTKRYSPGYGDWGIESQKEFLAFVQADLAGISVAPSGVMIPEKSVSAIVGWINK